MLNTLSNEEMQAETTPTKAQTEERRRMKAWLDERIAASKKRPSAEVVTLTPALAGLLVEESRNPVNRPFGRYNLETLKADVANKRWEFNGESIVISKTGLLLDGQHRCATVIATGIPIETVIVFGPRDEARYTIDIGKPKTAANFLHMKGRTDTTNMASMVSMLLQYRKAGNLNHGYVRPTKTEIVEAVESLPGLQHSVNIVQGATKRRLGSRSVLAFCHYVFARRSNRETADEFVTRLIDGDGLRRGNPIYYCRDRLIGMDRGARSDSRVELIFKCWNAWRQGQSITHCKLTGNLPKLER